MKLSKKKKIAIIITMSTIIVISISLSIFYYYHPTHYKYNDRFIMGNSVEAITERYGEFDRVNYNGGNAIYSGEYMVVPPKVGFFGTDYAKYYTIYFEDGVAVFVSYGDDWKGGL